MSKNATFPPARRAIVAVVVFWAMAAAAAQSADPPRSGGTASFWRTDLPAQEAFRDWPPAELLDRLYWFPWSPFAFQRAALFERPVFLLLTVSWSRPARRMLEQTLQDRRVQRSLNAGWLCVLVDADRRPDVRERYQTGVWPVGAFLLPDGLPMLSQANPEGVARPITTGYVDAEALLFLLREGRIYFDRWQNLLSGVGEVWREREGEPEWVAGQIGESASDDLARWLLGNADRRDGGVGRAPKFLVPRFVEYGALRDARLAPAVFDFARFSLVKIVESPLYDRAAGGLKRIATAPDWQGIEEEKLLSRNTELLREAVFALRLGEEDAEVLEQALGQTARFAIRVLGRPGGGFYLAQHPPLGAEDAEPGVDRLVLSGPNAQAGAALLRAGAWLGDPALEQAGRQALRLVLERGYVRGRGVAHVIEPDGDPWRYLESQAEVALAFVDAYEATGESQWLDAAEDIVRFVQENLTDPESPLFLDHVPRPDAVGLLAQKRHPLRPNAELAQTMVRLALLGRGEAYAARARQLLGAVAGDLTRFGVHGIPAALAVETLLREPLRIVLEGAAAGPEEPAWRRAALNAPWGWVVVETGNGQGAPRARLRWRETERVVDEASALARAVRELVEATE